MRDTGQCGELGLRDLKNLAADVSDCAHGRAYYAQTDSLQAQNYAQADFSLSARRGSVLCMTMEQKIRAIMEATGWKQQQFAEAIPVAQSSVNRWLQGSEPEGHRRDRIEELFRQHVGQTRVATRFVPIVGKAGAGPEGTVLFATGDSNFGEIEAPIDAGPTAQALEVQGDSMYGVANDGWIIFFEDREAPSPDHMGELCVCFLEDERVLVKIPYPGSDKGLFNLDSANAPPMRDIPVRAFAVVTDIKTRRAARRFIRRNPDHPIEDLKIA